MNRKVFAAFSKGVKRLSTPARIKYFTDCLLLATWSIAVISGLLALLSYSGVTEISFDIRRFHGLFCRIGGVLIVIHMIQHGRQIISYLKARDNSAMQ
ncbi:MAG: hypothetical protein LBI19_01930 [Oscillospiraceae bacterium]|jgi:hypothetical protein|nr:hypothetical protein [Oscillospiraceae bacterium]